MQQGRDCDGSGRGEIHSGNHSRGCGRRRNPHRRRRHGDDLGAGRQSRRIPLQRLHDAEVRIHGRQNGRHNHLYRRRARRQLLAGGGTLSVQLRSHVRRRKQGLQPHVGHILLYGESGRLRLHVHERLGDPVRNQRGFDGAARQLHLPAADGTHQDESRTGKQRDAQEDHHQHQRRRNADRGHDRPSGQLHRIVGNQFDHHSHGPEGVYDRTAARKHPFDDERAGHDRRRTDLFGQVVHPRRPEAQPPLYDERTVQQQDGHDRGTRRGRQEVRHRDVEGQRILFRRSPVRSRRNLRRLVLLPRRA